LVRIAGVVAIVAGHALRGWTYPWLFTWHVPVFFVLSGYLWRPDRSWRDELIRRCRSLLLPYVSWLVVNCLIWFAVVRASGDRFPARTWLKVLAGGAYLGYPPNAFWFVTALFIAALVMRAAWNLWRPAAWLIGLAGVVWATLAPASVRAVPEAGGIALAGVGLMCLGVALRRWREKLTRPILAGLVLGLPAWLIGGFGMVRNVDLKQGELGTPVASVVVSALISAGLVLAGDGLDRFIPKPAHGIVHRLAQAALPVVLGHCLVLWCLHWAGQPTTTALAFALALALPLAAGLALTAAPERLRRLFA
jgi:fucose 4-O-acetylase-like acetyltransferase